MERAYALDFVNTVEYFYVNVKRYTIHLVKLIIDLLIIHL